MSARVAPGGSERDRAAPPSRRPPGAAQRRTSSQTTPATRHDVPALPLGPALTPSYGARHDARAGGRDARTTSSSRPTRAPARPGPMIVDQSGSLVWFHPLPRGRVGDQPPASQPYEGKPVLTWWQGRILKLGFGQGEDEIYDTSYQPIAHVSAPATATAPTCTSSRSPRRDGLDRRLRPGRARTSRACGGSAHGVRQRLGRPGDRRQDRPGDVGVARARAHPAARLLHAAAAHAATRWDYVHVNSIDPGHRGGRAALRAQHLDDLRRQHAHGRASSGGSAASSRSFKRGPGTLFYWQHDAELAAGRADLGVRQRLDPPKEKQSRGPAAATPTRDRHRDARQAVHQPERDAAGLEPGQPAAACPAATG